MKTNTYKLYDIRTTLSLDKRVYFHGVLVLYYMPYYNIRLLIMKKVTKKYNIREEGKRTRIVAVSVPLIKTILALSRNAANLTVGMYTIEGIISRKYQIK